MNNETLQLITSVTKQDRPRGNAVIVRFASDKHARRFLDEFGDEVLSAQGVPRAPTAGDAGTIEAEIDDLRAVICGVGIVGQIDGHDVIRRASVLDLIDRSRAATAPVSAAPAAGDDERAYADGLRVGLLEGASTVRGLFLNHVHNTGVDGLLHRCEKAEQHLIEKAERTTLPPSAGAPVKAKRVTQEARTAMAEIQADVADVALGIDEVRGMLVAPVSGAFPTWPNCDTCHGTGKNAEAHDGICVMCEGSGRDYSAAPVSAAGQADTTGVKPELADGRELPALPEMDGLADIEYAQSTPEDWDEDYRATWTKLQVAERNKMQWRVYAMKLRELLAMRQPQGETVYVYPGHTIVELDESGAVLSVRPGRNAVKQAGKEPK